MTLRVCRGCTARYAPGVPACPQCQSTDSYEEGSMPKVHRDREPTDAGAAATGPAAAPVHIDGEHGPELVDLPRGAKARETEEGEQPSAGSSSETSPGKPATSQRTSGNARRKPARTTGSRSARDRGESSTADSTDGSGSETETSADTSSS